MMCNVGLSECQIVGEKFTYNINQANDPIYSRIAHVLGNTAWLAQFSQIRIEVSNTHISDHAPLRILLDCRNRKDKMS